ncbi:MAG TPA: NAD(P)H-dependent glycerol-3-phosphate dehydrogenase [Bryobacteraceae bacterium]|nr:NAD(P)H-dependent glycerol-3-phosphate dehydrogenase [Bryobacteraceae bacterium]
MTRLAIIGGGSWGTALAIVLSPRYDEVRLWVNEPDLCDAINGAGENAMFLPGFRLPGNIRATTAVGEAVANAQVVLGVMPSKYARRVYTDLALYASEEMVFVSATKGIEQGTLLRMSELISDVLGGSFAPRVAVLSGPTFAKEVARGEPTAVVISSTDTALARGIQREFSGPTFRLYTNSDPIGVEVGAALKNVIAIAAGVCKGLGLGHNVAAALITRGLAELRRLACAMGGDPLTLAGLAGLGDLVLTCTGELSRNRCVGIELAHGRSAGEIVDSMTMVAEGVDTASAALALAQKYNVDLPITAQMDLILRGQRSPREAIRELMERTLRDE